MRQGCIISLALHGERCSVPSRPAPCSGRGGGGSSGGNAQHTTHTTPCTADHSLLLVAHPPFGLRVYADLPCSALTCVLQCLLTAEELGLQWSGSAVKRSDIEELQKIAAVHPSGNPSRIIYTRPRAKTAHTSRSALNLDPSSATLLGHLRYVCARRTRRLFAEEGSIVTQRVACAAPLQ